MKYIARLSAAEWITGSGWTCGHGFGSEITGDVVEEWDVEDDEVEAWKKMIDDGERSLFDYVVDGFNDDQDGNPDDSEGDTKWTMQLVQIDDDDNEKVIASTWIYESVLRNKEE